MNTSLLLALLAACAATLYGLLATWVAIGGGHWFLRAATMAAAIGIFIPVPAYDLAIVFLAQSLTIIAPLPLLAAAQSAARRRASIDVTDNQSQILRHRFSLIDLFLVTLAAAGIAGLVTHLPEKHRPFWPSYALIGAEMGAVSLAAAWATLGQRWSWLRWLVLLAVAASVSFGMRLVQAPEQISEALFLESSLPAAPAPPAWFAPAIVCSTGMAIALLLFAIHRVWPVLPCRSESTQVRGDQLSRLKTKSIAVIVLLIIVSLLPSSTYVGMLCPEPIPREPHGPNGYQVLTKVGAEIEPTPSFDPDAVGEEALRSFVMANRQRLQEARGALDLPHVVPVDYQSSDVKIEWIRDIRSLSRAFTGEGNLAVMENRFDDAAMNYLDVMRLGCVTARGGLVVDWLVGIAIEGVGRSRLCSLLESIPPQTLPRLIAELQQLDASREPADDALSRERVWQQHAYGWPMRIWFVPAVEQTQAVRQATRTNIAKTRLLLCDLALRLYLAEHGELPEQLEQLVPECLSTLPDDPFGEPPPVYRPQGKTFLLYSIGPDHKDDGGAAIPRGALVGNGDLLLAP